MNRNKALKECFGLATWHRVLAAVLLLIVVQAGHADTTWVAAGSVSGLWHSGDSPYMISEGDVEVSVDSSLLILEGVEVKFTGAFTFRIFGLLHAEGTEQDSIYFTCDPDSTPNGWRGIRFNDADDTSLMSYCVIENSYAAGPFDLRYGGGVEIQSCSPSFANCTFRENRALIDGGGVYGRDGGVPQFEDCVFENNTAGVGGGILCRTQTNAVLTNCIFRGNSATTGGGVAAEYRANMILTNCLFEDNSATLGGGFKCDFSNTSPVLTNCIFVRNSADSSGSAVYLRRTAGRLQHCVFYGNEANGAGGGTILADTTGASIYNSVIASSIDGSGVHLNDASELTITGCDFFENEAGVFSGDTLEGFGISSRINLNFDSCDVHFNTFEDPEFRSTQTGDFHLTENSPCIAGGVDVLNFPDDFEGNPRSLPPNTNPDQGVFEHETGSPFLLCGELSGSLGAGEYAVTCDLVIAPGNELIIDRGASILFTGDYKLEVFGQLNTRGLPGNTVIFSRYFDDESLWGGIEFIQASDQSDVQYIILEYAHVSSEADRLHGGGIYFDRCGPTLNGCIIRNCEALIANSEGGGIYIGPDSYPLISGCTIENNRATMKGGGISVASNLGAIIDRCEIIGNESSLLGGGVYLHLSGATISSSIIADNFCSGKGGGLYSWWSPANISYCFVVGNTSDDKGGGIYVNSSSPNLFNCTIGGNHAANGGGGLTLNQTTAHIMNSIIAGCSGSGIEFTLNNTGAMIEFTDVHGNDPDNYTGLASGPTALGVIDTTNFNGDDSDIYFNISADPQFADTAAQNYSLTAGSHCINAGDPLDELDPDTTIADIGAVYFPVEHNPSTAFNLVSPPDSAGTEETNTILVWEASFDEGTANLVPLYRVQIAEDESFNNIVISQTVEDPALTVTTLADSTYYWWRVLAIGSNGIARTSNQIWSFYTVIPYPPTPFELLFPPDQDTIAVTESRLFCWEQSYDYDGDDFIVYEMNLESDDTLVTFSDLTDTCLNVVPIIFGLNGSGWVEWWVEASSNNPDTTVECDERFHFWLQDTANAVEETFGLPQEFALHANFPNPFNATTTLAFEIPIESDVSLRVLNIMGQEVAELVSGRQQPGSYRIDWNAGGYSSGVYLAVMQTDRQRWITKMMLLK